jgi:hypothetical protein
VLAEHGPGPLSVDAALFPRLKGPAWAALAIGSGVAGSYLATRPPFNEPAPEPQPSETAEAATANGGREPASATA